MKQERRGGTVVPSTTFAALVAAHVREHGENATARKLGVSRAAVAKLAKGAPVRAGTLLLAQLRVSAASPPEVAP